MVTRAAAHEVMLVLVEITSVTVSVPDGTVCMLACQLRTVALALPSPVHPLGTVHVCPPGATENTVAAASRATPPVTRDGPAAVTGRFTAAARADAAPGWSMNWKVLAGVVRSQIFAFTFAAVLEYVHTCPAPAVMPTLAAGALRYTHRCTRACPLAVPASDSAASSHPAGAVMVCAQSSLTISTSSSEVARLAAAPPPWLKNTVSDPVTPIMLRDCWRVVNPDPVTAAGRVVTPTFDPDTVTRPAGSNAIVSALKFSRAKDPSLISSGQVAPWSVEHSSLVPEPWSCWATKIAASERRIATGPALGTALISVCTGDE